VSPRSPSERIQDCPTNADDPGVEAASAAADGSVWDHWEAAWMCVACCVKTWASAFSPCAVCIPSREEKQALLLMSQESLELFLCCPFLASREYCITRKRRYALTGCGEQRVLHQLSFQWMEADMLLPLLNGLDEMDSATRLTCITAINAFHSL